LTPPPNPQIASVQDSVVIEGYDAIFDLMMDWLEETSQNGREQIVLPQTQHGCLWLRPVSMMETFQVILGQSGRAEIIVLDAHFELRCGTPADGHGVGNHVLDAVCGAARLARMRCRQ
jgi:hypothetical protein